MNNGKITKAVHFRRIQITLQLCMLKCIILRLEIPAYKGTSVRKDPNTHITKW